MEKEILRLRVESAAKAASILEVSSEKPGNITPNHSFSDTTYKDFLAGALALGPGIGNAAVAGYSAKKLSEIGVGKLILKTVKDVKASHNGGNTHLGTIFLMVPIAAAFGFFGTRDMGDSIKRILEESTIEDSIDFYNAVKIAKANVGGENLKEPGISFYEMLCSSASNDRIAEDLISDLKITVFTERALKKNLEDFSENMNNAIVQTYLELLASCPDILIAKKCGRKIAEKISNKAVRIVELEGLKTPEGRDEIKKFDVFLRSEPNNKFNPGTTADILAGSLLLYFLGKSKQDH